MKGLQTIINYKIENKTFSSQWGGLMTNITKSLSGKKPKPMLIVQKKSSIMLNNNILHKEIDI